MRIVDDWHPGALIPILLLLFCLALDFLRNFSADVQGKPVFVRVILMPTIADSAASNFPYFSLDCQNAIALSSIDHIQGRNH
jgi:hypothetical protein